ncbi:MAG: hypothetical protein LBT89_10960 [Planctomycetaceae bacterium]|jgi:hypothetical protein|nr:hypothetical protein [Planctomycetaceae bacterium]
MSSSTYIAAACVSLIVLAGPIALVWSLILRRRLRELTEHQEQLEDKYLHLQRLVSLYEGTNGKANPLKSELITLEPPENSTFNSTVKKPVPVVPFGEIDSFWRNESSVRQRKRLDTEIFSASQIQSAVRKKPVHSEPPRPIQGSVKTPRLRSAVLRWSCVLAAVWIVACAELYWYGIIGTEELYVNGVMLLVLMCMAIAAMVI